jgi:hypothetical protein
MTAARWLLWFPALRVAALVAPARPRATPGDRARDRTLAIAAFAAAGSATAAVWRSRPATRVATPSDPSEEIS